MQVIKRIELQNLGVVKNGGNVYNCHQSYVIRLIRCLYICFLLSFRICLIRCFPDLVFKVPISILSTFLDFQSPFPLVTSDFGKNPLQRNLKKNDGSPGASFLKTIYLYIRLRTQSLGNYLYFLAQNPFGLWASFFAIQNTV